MPPRIEVEEGARSGRLTFMKELSPKIRTNGNLRRVLLCICECGTQKEVLFDSFISGRVKSCGCYQKEVSSKQSFNKKHGLSDTKIFTVWKRMIERCTSQKHKCYKDYGGRGITVCDEWISDPVSFYNWAITHGYAEGLQLDRRDNEKGYSPHNCRFVTPAVNRANSRPRRMNGESVLEYEERTNYKVSPAWAW